MARKRKTKKQVAKAVELSTPTEKQELSYQGKVSVKVMHGNKIISTKTFKNKGMPNLFKFISHALAGSFYSEMRPCKIKLFYTQTAVEGDTPIFAPSDFKWDGDNSTSKQEISPYVVYDATPIVSYNEESYETLFRFKIPFTWLFGNEYNIVGLFNSKDEICAYYLFTNNNEWDTQKLTEAAGNYSLIIEWTMSVSNKS